MTQIRRESLAEQAAHSLLDRIRSGEWALGDKLPGETTLAPQVGVGRSTIREAIRQLAGRGILATRQGAGVFVTALDTPVNWGHILSHADIASVIEARIAIEVEAATLAAIRRSATGLLAMRQAAEERNVQHSTIDSHVDADMAFHRSIVIAAKNPILTELFDSFAPRNRQAMVDLLRIRGEYGGHTDQQAHERILDAIADHDSGLASALTREHLFTLKQEQG